ncbi:hypothetical protein [Streptacidiphilus melanogenes]|uniref:hypothetical protein n=1 Tax=Streptacidiphilus melanogenes TaxID=411235 RepID=UPI00126A013D|nr:hypothetical protein [Streptacidiphilus melanogenes]
MTRQEGTGPDRADVTGAARALSPEALEQLRTRALEADPHPVDWATAAARAAFEAAHAAQRVSHGLADLRRHRGDAEWLLDQARRERAALEAESAELTAALPGAEVERDRARRDRDGHQQALTRLSAEAGQARADCEEAQQQRREAEEEQARLGGERDAARASAGTALSRLEEERAGLARERTALEAHEAELRRLVDERTRCRAGAADARRQADEELRLLAQDRAALEREELALRQARAERARERELLLHVGLSRAADDLWERARQRDRRFGDDLCPEADGAAALWTVLHLALLRLPEEERRAEARALADVARDLGIDPGTAEPSDDSRAATVVLAVPPLPLAEAVPALRLTVATPSWPELDTDAQEEVRSLLREVAAVNGDHQKLANRTLDAPEPGDLLLRGAVRVRETLLLLRLDPLLGRHLGTQAREWRPWQADGLRNDAVQQLARLGVALAARGSGDRWSRPVAERLHQLDELLAVHHRCPAAADSWWRRHRDAALPELASIWQQAGCRALTDPGQLLQLLTLGDASGPYLERNDLSPRPKPVLQWVESVPVVRERDGQVVQKGRLVCGVVDV